MSQNRLNHETSPYLLQHASNPVDWYPWGDEAFARAQREDKPILLSIGYAACHWCHVMERESFAVPAVATLMNANFVCIKVDREERPDVDEVYMAATVAMNQGRGGWPMTVFLTPEKQPFFAGTYFPPEDRHGYPGFPRLMQHIANLWQTQRPVLTAQAGELAQLLCTPERRDDGTLSANLAARAIHGWQARHDPVYGGFGGAPKFPPATQLMTMLQVAPHGQLDLVRDMVKSTLDGMAHGGMRDHLGGGFARYSTDAQWLVPHFEKMLYDNALLGQAYLVGLQQFDDPAYAQVVREILAFFARDMTDAGGALWASLDADSEHEEGKCYVWTPTEVAQVLQDEALTALVCRYYDITDAGNWEGKGVVHTPRPLGEVAEGLGLNSGVAAERLQVARAKLLAARRTRVQPATDDKVITAWNGLAITLLGKASRVLGDSDALTHARTMADFLLQHMLTQEGRLLRAYRAGRAHVQGFLEDYAYLCEGLIALYESGAPKVYLQHAQALANEAIEGFRDADSGAFFTTASHHETLFMRMREGHDGATPNANATFAAVLLKLSHHTDKPHYAHLAREAILAYATPMQQSPQAFARALAVWHELQQVPTELAFATPNPEANVWQAFAGLGRNLPAGVVVAHGAPGEHPLLMNRPCVDNKVTLYICRGGTCQAPVTDVPSALQSLRELNA